ncbi:MAG: RNA methyltransferase [Chloroflexi bacterium]|nr:RNA methyltransferase [Chloroflexota bacterium]
MSVPPFQLRQCGNFDCRFRFPVTDIRQTGKSCPHCGAPTKLALSYPQAENPAQPLALQDKPIVEALLDNLRSVYNVGSILRTADGAGIRHLHLCGITPPPDHPKIKKTSLGAEEAVAWSQRRNGLDTAVALKQRGYQLWAIEETPQSESLFTAVGSTAVISPDAPPILLIVGNEVTGVDPEIMAQCHRVLHIPMQGRKKSLNVATAFGVAAYFVRFGQLE